jgi:Protein of unknown function (DUF3179)
MKKLFYFAVLGLCVFEIANVYFIMPMPGSQEMQSIGGAYFLYHWRWFFRILLGLLILYGLKTAFQKSKVFSILSILIVAGIAYATNFEMAADAMFLQPQTIQMSQVAQNKVDTSRIIIGVEYNGEAKAYPIQFLGYHHQVFDTIADKPIIVTYCTVCRSGRVFEPVVNGTLEKFRLVGMDHFNAMFEDETTHSWWRQATSEAIAGPLKGRFLPEMSSNQMALKQWLALYPNSTIMQSDQLFQMEYDSMSNYEAGRRTGTLTRRDSLSWEKKSWVLGIKVGNVYKAYDWNNLVQHRLIHDIVNDKPIVVVLANDNKSFSVLQRISPTQVFNWQNDTLSDQKYHYNLLGIPTEPDIDRLKKIKAYQEYWHSWRTFHPETLY